METYTIKQELDEYIEDYLSDNREFIKKIDLSELHHQIFNEDYYIIGYYKAEQWLKKHNVSVFEGIKFVQNYERENFGDDAVRTYDNAESLVNMITYIIGEELIYDKKTIIL